MSNGMHPSTERPPEIRTLADAPYLPQYGLTSLQVVCAIELSKGRKGIEIQKQFNISRDVWKRWKQNPKFAEHITALLTQRAAIVEDVLKEGELQAAAVLLGSLNATVPIKHKDGKIREHPNWEVRLRAAMSFLDRSGLRGKPVERVVSKNENFNSNEVRNELTQALADPAVRAFLAADPAFAARLRKELGQLAPPEEPCDTSATPSLPPPVSGSTSSPTPATAPSIPSSAPTSTPPLARTPADGTTPPTESTPDS